jgi:transposase
MLNLEDFMNIRALKQQGWSVSAIADELSLDRKTVRKHLLEAPRPYKRENPAPCKIDPYRPFLRERWETGVHNARSHARDTAIMALQRTQQATNVQVPHLQRLVV